MMEPLFLAVAAFLTGACLGSFLNVCIFRLPAGQSVVRPGSACPGCGRALSWFENVPILSWVALRGRCRTCGMRISVQYPLIELVTGLIWGGMIYAFGLTWEAGAGALFLTLLLGIALTDARTYIIPDAFTLGGLVLGLLLALLGDHIGFLTALVGAALGFGLLYAVAVIGEWIFKKQAMGGGDIKMMAMVGAFVGPTGVVLTIFLGALLGSVIFGPISMKTKKLVPFGIFLSLGAVVTLLWGELLVGWYLRYALGGG